MPAADTVYTEWHFWNFDYIWDVRQDFTTSVSKERHCRRLSEVGVYMDSLWFLAVWKSSEQQEEKKEKNIVLFYSMSQN